ncbi:hypothetical protein M0R88_05945 [Halorussus gelatinilyticus]|uniref:Uncharacterized protein n=1 Tax=Halorussus gelatinilyticus TaxID=2937524 RepID=A0A8U0IM03_9EURY|nr:hypothetical protein [Halorussus gelatinilyticus]UPW01641.1 hypothetical protein M0R88_05945 [Halorussus gelatinilyticus]
MMEEEPYEILGSGLVLVALVIGISVLGVWLGEFIVANLILTLIGVSAGIVLGGVIYSKRFRRIYVCTTAIGAHLWVLGDNIHYLVTCTEWCIIPWWLGPGMMVVWLLAATLLVLGGDYGLRRYYTGVRR